MEKASQVLAENGLRCTRQRQEVYRALASTTAHPTAEELHGLVARDNPTISLATVYNALEAFCTAGLARKMPMAEGPARYDADLSDHLHFVGDDGRLVDVPTDLGDRILAGIPRPLLAELEARMGVRIERVEVGLVGRRSP